MNRRLCRPRRRVRPVWWLVALALATVAVWQRYTVVRLGAEVEALQGEIVTLARVRDHLLAETASLSSRERIEAIAVRDLGLDVTDRSRQHILSVAGGQAAATRGEPYTVLPAQ